MEPIKQPVKRLVRVFLVKSSWKMMLKVIFEKREQYKMTDNMLK